MPLLIISFFICYLVFSVLLGGNKGRNPLFPQTVPEPISVTTPIRKKMFGGREALQQRSGNRVIRHLTAVGNISTGFPAPSQTV